MSRLTQVIAYGVTVVWAVGYLMGYFVGDKELREFVAGTTPVMLAVVTGVVAHGGLKALRGGKDDE